MINMFAGDNADFDFVNSVNIIITENKELAADIINDANKVIKKLKTETLLEVNDEGQKITIYCCKDGEVITNLLVTIDGGDQSGFLAISGDIPQEKLNEVINVVNM